MSTQPTKKYFDYLISLAAVVTVLGFIINYWSAAGSFASTIWQHLFVNIWFIWLGLGVYGAVRLARFLRTLHVQLTEKLPGHLNELNNRVSTLEADVASRVEAEAKSRIAGDESTLKKASQEIKELCNTLRVEIATEELSCRQLAGLVSELKKQLATQTKREPSAADLASRHGMVSEHLSKKS